MPALEDLRSLVKQVAGACKASPRDVAAVWGSLCDHVADRLLAGTGVTLPGLATFAVGPAFLLDDSFGAMSAHRGGLPTPGAPVAPLNFAAVAARAKVARAASTSLLRALLATVKSHIHARKALTLDFGVGLLHHGDGTPFSFTFTDAFLARCGHLPSSRREGGEARYTGQLYDADTASQPQRGVHLSPECALLQAACRAGGSGSGGSVPRVTVEALLRGPCAAAVAGVDALSLLRLLDDATEAHTGGVRYAALAAALTAHARGAPSHSAAPPQSPARPVAVAVPAASSREGEHGGDSGKGAAAHMMHNGAPLPAPNDAFLSRRGVDAYNDVLRSSSRAMLAASGGIAPKITTTHLPWWSSQPPPAAAAAAAAAMYASPSRAATPSVEPPRGSLAAQKRAEVLADAARLRSVLQSVEQERSVEARNKRDKQLALRALLDEQVAVRVASRAATPAVREPFEW
jgi:nucleoid DNA-binding protein